jgi:molybdopterin converting factor small subunit
MSLPSVTIELFGVPRARAGRKDLIVSAATAGEALIAAIKECPGLAEVCRSDRSLAPQYLLSLDGKRFVTDLSELLSSGDRLLIFSADAGG